MTRDNMKYDSDDAVIKKLLVDNLPEARENEWFTHRTLHRLPTRDDNRYAWVEMLAYALALCMCVVLWCLIFVKLGDFNSTITVRDMLYCVALIAVSIAVPACAAVRYANRY